MRLSTRSSLVCCLALTAAGWAAGQDVRERTDVRHDSRTGTTEIRRATTVIGSSVRLAGGAQWGRIEDIVLNENGCIDFVVLANADRFVLVPWSATRVDFTQRFVTIDVPADRIQTITFTRDNWPNISDTTYIQRVQGVFGVTSNRRVEGRTDINTTSGPGGNRTGTGADRTGPGASRPGNDRTAPPGETRTGADRAGPPGDTRSGADRTGPPPDANRSGRDRTGSGTDRTGDRNPPDRNPPPDRTGNPPTKPPADRTGNPPTKPPADRPPADRAQTDEERRREEQRRQDDQRRRDPTKPPLF